MGNASGEAPVPLQAERGMPETEFTLDRYRALVRRALHSGYRIGPFRDFLEGDGPSLLLRHDLDHAIGPALTIAEVEAALGVCSTFFVQTTCDFYNLLGTEARAGLRRIVALGHEIGLHYVSARYAGPDGRDNLRADIRLLEDLTGQRITSAAQHIPIDGAPVVLSPEIGTEAYEARFTEAPMRYVSDSLMVWRDVRPEDLLEAGASFQFLTHPENWTEGARDINDLLARLERQTAHEVHNRFANLRSYYARLLAERAERDRRFRAARDRHSP